MSLGKINNEDVALVIGRMKKEYAVLLALIHATMTNSEISQSEALLNFWKSKLGNELMIGIQEYMILVGADIDPGKDNGSSVEVFLEPREFAKRDAILALQQLIRDQVLEQFGVSIAQFRADHGSTIYVCM